MDVVALALAKKYTEETADEFGAVKGANCQLMGYETVGNQTKILFQWKNEAEETRQSSVFVPNGEAGVGVKDVYLAPGNHLIVVLTDNSKIDTGIIETEDRLSEPLTATVSIGSVSAGKTYPKGTALESILRDILIKVEAPGVSISLAPNKTVFDAVNEFISKVTVQAILSKKTYALKQLDLYVDAELIHSEEVTSGGLFEFEFVPATPINKSCVFKAVVTDEEGNSSAASLNVSFVGSSYYGIVEPEVGAPTEAIIKSLNKNLKTTKGYVYKGISCDYNKVVYAYPASFGALTSIKDVENNINYTNSFTRTSLKVDGIDYYCYTLNEPTGADGVNVTFA